MTCWPSLRNVFLSTTSIFEINVLFVHMVLLVIKSTKFSYGVNLLFCGLGVGGSFSLLVIRFVVYKSNMLLCLLRRTVKFVIAYLFLVLSFNNLVECVLASPRVCIFIPYKQPKNPKSVVNLEILLKHVHKLLQ
jgi:hypothetical protein